VELKDQAERAVVGSTDRHSPLSEVLPSQQVKVKMTAMISFAMFFL